MRAQTHYRSENEMALSLGIHRNTVARMVSRPDFPQKDGKRGWLRESVNKFFVELKRKLADQQAGPNAEVKRRKLEAEANRIERDVTLRDLEIELKKGNQFPIDLVTRLFNLLCSYFLDEHALLISNMKVKISDAGAIKEMEILADESNERIRRNIDGLSREYRLGKVPEKAKA